MQDPYVITQDTFALFDPLGGEAADRVLAVARNALQVDTTDIVKALERANRLIRTEVSRHSSLHGVGFTAAAIKLAGPRCTVAWVGDVGVLRFRDGKLDALTRPHVLPRGAVVTRALGMAERVAVEAAQENVSVGDVYVLASDATCASLAPGAIAATVARHKPDARRCARGILALAQNAGHGDQASVLVVVVRDDGAMPGTSASYPVEHYLSPTSPTYSYEPSAEQERQARRWREAATPARAWARFRAWASRADNAGGVGEALVETSPLQSHEQATGAGARVLLLFEKRDILRRFVAHHVGIGARSMPKIAAASVPPAPTPYDVALIRAHAKLLGSPVVGYVGDLDPHGVHAFAALRSGKIDAPNICGRHFQVEWLGMTDHWLRLARVAVAH